MRTWQQYLTGIPASLRFRYFLNPNPLFAITGMNSSPIEPLDPNKARAPMQSYEDPCEEAQKTANKHRGKDK